MNPSKRRKSCVTQYNQLEDKPKTGIERTRRGSHYDEINNHLSESEDSDCTQKEDSGTEIWSDSDQDISSRTADTCRDNESDISQENK